MEAEDRDNQSNTVENNPPSAPSSTSQIFKKFQRLYAHQLKETGDTSDGLKLKVKILENWVGDLTEQNVMLVQTVEELETEALKRLSMLEANLTQSQDTTQKDCISGSNTFSSKGLNCRVETLCRELDQVKRQLSDKEKLISKYQSRIEELSSSIEGEKSDDCNKVFAQHYSKPESICDHDRNVQPSVYRELETTRSQLSQVEREVTQLKKKLKDAESNIKRLRSDLVASEKNAREMRAALTAEVAEKHDQILALRREVNQLEEQLRQADMQTHFKDDIIKELRKEVKVARSKLDYLGLCPTTNRTLTSNRSSTPDKIKLTKPSFTPFNDKLNKSKNNDLIANAIDVDKEVESIIKTYKSATKASSVQFANKATCTSPVRENKSEQIFKHVQYRSKRKVPHRPCIRRQGVELCRDSNPELILERTEVCPIHGDISVWTTICTHPKDFTYK